MNFRLSTQDSHVNFINISQGMLISARLDVSKSPTKNLGSTTRVRSRKCHLFRTNDGPAALPVTVSKSVQRWLRKTCPWFMYMAKDNHQGAYLAPAAINSTKLFR